MSYLDDCLKKGLPNFNKQVMTIGVQGFLEANRISLMQLDRMVYEEYKRQPDEDLTGGNDKRFFTITFELKGIYNQKMFVAENEIGGLTIMLPEEY